MKPNADHYAYRVLWSEEDQEFVGLCAEFPSLSWLAGKPETALKSIRGVVADELEDMQQSGEKIPQLLSLKSFSRKFQVRTQPAVHRELAICAVESDVSFNRFVSAKLSRI